ncbi:MAG: nucleotidyltransferase domain-containing protein [Planctomycetota bacterium]
MNRLILQHRCAIAVLCKWFRVQQMDLFGSATSDAFDPDHSDVDFLVKFADPMPIRRSQAYFQLKAELEALVGRKVDLVEPGRIRNDFYRLGIEATREPLDAA